jgi:osomolarity two-component system response regulator SSK1
MENAVVDELRDQVIRKYANSLGRKFDSPDIVTTITPRQGLNRQAQQERLLNPDEKLSSVLDTYYPGGQTIEEALVIDVPTRYNPSPSSRYTFYSHGNSESGQHGDSFPLMLRSENAPVPPPRPPSPLAGADPPSRSISTTDVVPSLPSPGSLGPQHTSNSPATLCQVPTMPGMLIFLRYLYFLAEITIDIDRARQLFS